MDSRLEDRLLSIEARLIRLENQLKISSPPAVATKATSDMAAPQSRQQTELVQESRPGNWLGIIAVICFVLAAGFIIKLSIESGWLTPVRQVGLATLLGFGLIGAGIALRQADREYASYLPGAGVIILYLTAFASYRYYSLVSFEVAIGLSSLVSVLCIWLYWQIKHDVYPVTAAIGSYVAPIVLGFKPEAIFTIYYFLICSVAFAVISIWMRSRILTLISAYLAIILTAVIGVDLHDNQFIASILGLHFLIFALGTYLYTRVNESPLTSTEAWSFFPVLLIFYAVEYYFVDRIQDGLAPWVSLTFAAVLAVLYIAAQRLFPHGLKESKPVVLAYAAVVAFHSIYLELLPDDFRPWLFVTLTVAFAAVTHMLAGKESRSSYTIPMITFLVIAIIEYLSMVHHLLEGYEARWLLVSFMAVFGLWSVLIFGDQDYLRSRKAGSILPAAAHILAILALYRLVTEHGSLAVSASWLLYAVAVIAYAFIRKDEIIAKSALFVLGFAAGKALLYDAASAPTVVRIFCLLLTGAVLYGCGFFMRKIGNWKGTVA